jgi:hypothetical protein
MKEMKEKKSIKQSVNRFDGAETDTQVHPRAVRCVL